MHNILQKIAEKTVTKREVFEEIEKDFSLIPSVLKGISSEKASVRYSCASVLMDLSEKHPEKLYPYMDSFVGFLDSRYRILIWNAMETIANLARVDKDHKIDPLLTKYYILLKDEYMVTVANAVGSLGKIASAKPYLAQRIAEKLLEVEGIHIGPHLTEECKRVIAEKTIESFDLFVVEIKDRNKILRFVRSQLDSPRKTLRIRAEKFLREWKE